MVVYYEVAIPLQSSRIGIILFHMTMILLIALFVYLFLVSQFIGKIKTEATGGQELGGPFTNELFNVLLAAWLPVMLVTIAIDGFMSLFIKTRE